MKMKNAILSGLIIGVVSALWIIVMHLNGYTPETVAEVKNGWLEYTSILVPFIGLYFGIKGYRDKNGGSLTFFEGIFEGFKIMAVGGIIAGAFSSLYFAFINQELTSDYMERVFGAVILGLLFTLVHSLLLMTTPKAL
jgi:hypothetical protein